jgi:hypothetical protein
MRNPICALEMKPMKGICGATEGVRPEGPSISLSRFRWQWTANGVLIYDIPSDAVFETNGIALEILSLLADDRSCQQIAVLLGARYRLSSDAILEDVKEFFCALVRYGFVEKR